MTSEDYDFEFMVFSNGCTDNTAQVSQTALEEIFVEFCVRIRVHETFAAEKARPWNLAVHSIYGAAADIVVLMDADIELIDVIVILDLVRKLLYDEHLPAVAC